MKRKIIFIGILIIIMIHFSISGICSIKSITYEDKNDLINWLTDYKLRNDGLWLPKALIEPNELEI